MHKINNPIEATSIAYFLAYKCLMERNQEVSDYYRNNISIYIFPAVTLASLSCEIALKNHLNNVGITMKVHNLRQLFDAIPMKEQTRYTDATVCLENYKLNVLNMEFKFNQTEFTNALERCKLTFTNCRYLYEGIQNIDVDFIERFMFALNDEADQYESFLNGMIGKR